MELKYQANLAIFKMTQNWLKRGWILFIII